jgi:DNA-binding transcriptional ArsR family regulator
MGQTLRQPATTLVFELQAALCRAMSNATRIRLVHALRDGPASVAAIAEAAGIPPTTASKHLLLLRQQGIVTAQRDGSSIIYAIANPKVARICDLMREILAEQETELAALIHAMEIPNE